METIVSKSIGNTRWGLWGTWGKQSLTLGEFSTRTHHYISALQRAHSDFRDLFLIGDSERNCQKLGADLSNLEEWIFANSCFPDPSPRSAYSHNDANNRPTRETIGGMGFSIELADSLHSSSKGGLKLVISAGGDGYPINAVQLDYFDPTRHDMLSVDLQKELLEIAIDHWPLEDACFASGDLLDELRIPTDGSRPRYINVGWLTYSRNPERGRVLPSDFDCKPFGPGGVLVTAMDHQPSPDNEQDLERLKLIRDTWNAAGLLRMTWERS